MAPPVPHGGIQTLREEATLPKLPQTIPLAEQSGRSEQVAAGRICKYAALEGSATRKVVIRMKPRRRTGARQEPGSQASQLPWRRRDASAPCFDPTSLRASAQPKLPAEQRATRFSANPAASLSTSLDLFFLSLSLSLCFHLILSLFPTRCLRFETSGFRLHRAGDPTLRGYSSVYRGEGVGPLQSSPAVAVTRCCVGLRCSYV